ncbi:hypothetical protein Tsubulata_046815 [Turnera subulata]|uniref:Beta-glucosidase n=1 Tax=Turnera subulata TaxID=218843 RepID=A0A9Q0FSI6_9ROSI|nr:hypothetical protein Tsubulata_046815 [Turnera subulata]
MECMNSFFNNHPQWGVNGRSLLLGIIMSLILLSSLDPVKPKTQTNCTVSEDNFSRKSFPDGFIFGTASSAYQYEGATDEGGKGRHIWDTFTHEHPERIQDGSNGGVAIDFYHRYKEDIRKMKELNMDSFRFSISWARILPNGTVKGGVNQEGIDFYNNLIDEIVSNGLVPFITLFHWDTPQALQDEYDGFLSRRIVKDFQDYADLCFQEFGDRVKHWVTINEPWAYSYRAHDQGDFAPGRCSSWVKGCKHGNSATEPYIVAHNQLLAHAAAVQVYREKHQALQNGEIGMTLNTYWYEPHSNSVADKLAAKRALDFMFGWFMDPMTFGEYPTSMRAIVGERLPKFTAEESMRLKGSYDFIGLNYYSSYYAADASHLGSNPNHFRYETDSHVNATSERDGVPIGLQAASSWLNIYPQGIRYLLNHTKDTYKNPNIYITENGYDEFTNPALSLEEALDDTCRIQYYRDHLKHVLKSIKDYNVKVKGFFVWSYADNFEWECGYTVRFGLYYIDYADDLKRHPKRSVMWFKNFLRKDSFGNGLTWSRLFGFKNPGGINLSVHILRSAFCSVAKSFGQAMRR